MTAAVYAALLDTAVLVPVTLTDTLLRLAERGLFRPMWSSEILDELSRAVTRVRPGIDPEAVDRRIQAMDDFFPDAKVLSAAWRPLVEGLDLPDPDDRHILAAAIAGGAQCIVTRNINHFPASCLASYSIEAVTPDAFLLDRFDQRPHDVLHTLRQQAADTAHPRLTVIEVVARLALAGAPAFADEMLRHLDESS